MKYEFFKVYKKDELPRGAFKESWEHSSYLALSYSWELPTFPIKYCFINGGWFAFCPVDKSEEKFVCLNILEPPHKVMKAHAAESIETIKKMKELKDKLNSL